MTSGSSRRVATDCAASVAIADAGIETALEERLGQHLPEFAAFVLLDREEGRAALREYYRPFVELAVSTGLSLVLDTPTWRASADWGDALGYDAGDLERANLAAAELTRAAAGIGPAGGTPAPVVTVGGCIGPRYEGGRDSSGRETAPMSPGQAERYHAAQVRALAAGGVDRIHAVTMGDSREAEGIVGAARRESMPVVISFAVGMDARLESGETLAEAILAVDRASGSYPLGYLVNCAHPSEAARALAAMQDPAVSVAGDPADPADSGLAMAAPSGPGTQPRPGAAAAERVIGFRLNAARHGEESGDSPEDFARGVLALRRRAPASRVFGGCCGTDVPHIAAIAAGLRAGTR